jgi:NAD(P)H-nitrite reductase large subunit
MHYVIIGNGVAGINAAHTLRNRDNDAEITIISYESDNHFSRTALMYVFCGQLSNRCVEPYERDHYGKMGFKRVRDKVTRLDSSSKTLHMESGQDISYDKLLIASGSLPVMLNWPGIENDGVGNFVTWQNMEWLKEKAKTAKKAVVVGGGLIGIETVEILLHAGIEVSFIIRENYYWPIALSKEEGDLITEHMTHHGVDVQLKTEFGEVLGKNGKVVGITTGDGERIDCDIVVFCIGVRPQTDWLKETSLEFDERGGIVVNDYLETNLSDVYAAGDCTSVVWFNGVRRPEQLWYTGRDQGKIAGWNIYGDKKIYKRSTFYNSAKFFDIEYTTAGLVNFNFEGEQEILLREKDKYKTVRLVYLPDKTVIGYNMLGRRWDHRVLVNWIEAKKKLDWVLDHLREALFDEEFMPQFEIIEEA